MAGSEDAIRKAAQALKKAIDDGRKEGKSVAWPLSPDGLDNIAVSDTGGVKVVTTVQVDPTVAANVDPAALSKASDDAQAAAERAIAKAEPAPAADEAKASKK